MRKVYLLLVVILGISCSQKGYVIDGTVEGMTEGSVSVISFLNTTIYMEKLNWAKRHNRSPHIRVSLSVCTLFFCPLMINNPAPSAPAKIPRSYFPVIGSFR